MKVLGIDYGVKYTGLAVVDQETNKVLHAVVVYTRDDISDKLESRASMRRFRRSRKRYRKPKLPVRGGSSTKTRPDYRKATGLNLHLYTECKYVDKETGEVCGKNTPMKKNVRSLLLENILSYLKVDETEKQLFRDLLNPKVKTGTPLKELFTCNKVNRHVRAQINSIVNKPLSGRAAFCSEHITKHTEQIDIDKECYWLPPSVQARYDCILGRVGSLKKEYNFSAVKYEKASFDIELLKNPGTIFTVSDRQTGPRSNFSRNTNKALRFAFYNHCAYCGQSLAGKPAEKDHVVPKSRGGGDNWENLVLSCKGCNSKKGNRTLEEAGMSFATINIKVGGKILKVKLAPKKVDVNTRLIKYATQTDQGYRYFLKSLEDIVGGDNVSVTYGYITSSKRENWDITEKDHDIDAVVIASKEKPVNIEDFVKLNTVDYNKNKRSKVLFDQNPLQRNGNMFFQSKVVRELSVSRFKSVTNESKKRLLLSLVEKYKVKGNKVLPPEVLEKVPFKKVRLKMAGVGPDKVKKINNNWFKIATATNVAIGVYKDEEGKVKTGVIKNPKIYKRPEHAPVRKYDQVYRVGTEVSVYGYKSCGKEVMNARLNWIMNNTLNYLNVTDVEDGKQYASVNPKHLYCDNSIGILESKGLR